MTQEREGERGQERENPRRESEQVRERVSRTGGLAPLWFPAQRPLLGAPGLVAVQAAAPGGAGRRQRKEGAAAPSINTQEGVLCPLPSKERGGLCPPPAENAQGAQVGPPGRPRPPAQRRRRPELGWRRPPQERRRGLLPPQQRCTGGREAPWPSPRPPA